MRILWSSNSPFASTGYGVQTKRFVPAIRDLGHDVSVLAFYGLEGGVLKWGGIEMYPRAYHPYGQDVIRSTAEHVNADIVISLMDAWVCEPQRYPEIRHVPWFPVDMEPLPEAVKRVVERAFARIVMSRFGERMMDEAGLDCLYVPHGVDTSVYRPMDKATARFKIDPTGAMQDKFIVGMVAANKGNAPSRKAYPEHIQAFARFAKDHPDAVLYLHTTAGPQQGGVHLIEYAQHCGLEVGQNVVFCNQFHNHLGFPDEYMVDTYNAFDVLMNVSMGEGFGVPILEAQACGVPVIVGDWTAMSELCFDGWRVSKDEALALTSPMMGHKAVQWLPHVEAIVDRLEQAYAYTRDTGIDHEAERQKRAMWAAQYDIAAVTETYWKPVLETIAARVEGHKRMVVLDHGEAQPVPSGLEAAE